MGRGVITSPQKKDKSGPVEVIVSNTLQPGWEKYISTPIVQVSAMNGSNISRGTTSCSTSWPWGGGTDENPLFGNMHSLVRINFTPNAIGKTCTITYNAKASARFGCTVQVYTTNGTIYYSSSPAEVTRTATFIIDKENFYFITRGDWDGHTTVWSPSTSASVGYLSLE